MFSKNLEALKDDILETSFIYIEMSNALLVSTDLETCFFSQIVVLKITLFFGIIF